MVIADWAYCYPEPVILFSYLLLAGLFAGFLFGI
jgi:hypothetical protein